MDLLELCLEYWASYPGTKVVIKMSKTALPGKQTSISSRLDFNSIPSNGKTDQIIQQSNNACCMLNIHNRDRPQALPVSEIPSSSINVPIANLATVRQNRTPHVDIGLFIIRETAARYIIELTVEKILAHARIQWKVKIWSKTDKKRNESGMSEVIKVGGLWVQSCLSWYSKSGKWYLYM